MKKFLIVMLASLPFMAHAALPSDPDPIESNTIQKHYVIGDDDRGSMDITKYPWRAIGRLQMLDDNLKKIGHCTGVLVGERVVLTNSHCISPDNGKTLFPQLRFYPGYKKGVATIYSTVKGRSAPQQQTSETDFAIVTLNSALGKRFGYLALAPFDKSFYSRAGWTDRLALAGYSSDRNRGEIGGVHMGCSFISDQPGLGFFHDCDSQTGASGGPILAWFNKHAYIVGLNWGGNRKKGLNYAAYAKAIHAAFADTIAATHTRSRATVHLCNSTDNEALFYVTYAALGTYLGQGWTKVPANECIEYRLDEISGYGKSPIYAAAIDEKNGVIWTGKNKPAGEKADFCTPGAVRGVNRDVHKVAANCPGKSRTLFKCGDFGDDAIVQCWINK